MFRLTFAAVVLSMAGSGLAADAAKSSPEVVQELKTGVLLDRVVAVVNEGLVTESELNEQVPIYAARLREQKVSLPEAALRSQVLDRLVLQEIQLQRAGRLGIKVSDEQLNSQMAELAKKNNLSLQELPRAMAASGIEYASYRDNTRKEMILSQLFNHDVRQRISVTPRELEQFIDKIRHSADPDSEYNTSHILLALPADATQAKVDEITRRAEDIINRARTEDFASLAAANSNSADALEGGQLGWRKGPELPTIFQGVVESLKPGEVSKPLVDANGIHLVRLNEKRSNQGDPIQDQTHSRHILMKPNELQDDATVRLKLSGLRDRILKGEDFAVIAASVSEDPGSAVKGGDLDWMGSGAFVPEFEAMLATLKENEISQPFQSQFGWHIVQLLGRRKFDTTEESLRNRAYQQLVQSREDSETDLWVRKLRDEAFVDISM